MGSQVRVREVIGSKLTDDLGMGEGYVPSFKQTQGKA